MQPISTYCSDPAATHTVDGKGPDGGGNFGYYTSEFDAHRAARYWRGRGNTCSVNAYDPAALVAPGVHPAALAYALGY